MNIVCDKTLLSAAIDGVSKAVTMRSAIPVLEGILLKAEGFQLTLTGYDLEMGIVTTIEANVKEPGEIVLNAKLLSSMISRMPAGQISILSADNGKTTIKSGVAEFEIQSMAATDFPDLPNTGAEETLTIPTGVLRDMIDRTLYAVSQDEKKPAPLILASALKKDVKRLKEKYPRQARAIETYLQKLKACEQEASIDLDRAAADTGEMLGEIYVWKEDVWADTMRKIGCAMGRFIYRMDAYEDIEKDRKKGNYNPWKPIAQEKDFDDRARQILMMEAAEASRQFEKLPIIEYVDILRNILYSGIWTKYDRIKSREKETRRK